MALRRPVRPVQYNALSCSCQVGLLLASALLVGCAGAPGAGESGAQRRLDTVGRQYRPAGERPVLPQLEERGQFDQFVLYAVLNNPQVAAAYHAWAASVHRITVERSRPDPRLTLQASIADMALMALMAGVMTDVPSAGKRAAAGDIATAESQAKYFTFEARVLQSAFALRKVRYQLDALDTKIAIMHETARLLAQLEKLALVQNEVGRAPMQDVLQARIERARLASDIANLDDSRDALLAQFKAALGIPAGAVAPPVSAMPVPSPPAMTADRLLELALERNPRLKAMQAEVAAAQGSLQLARKSARSDFSVGLEADWKASPIMLQPSLGVSVPIWRAKTKAQIAAAQANKAEANARLSAEQIALAVEIAEKTFMSREATRQLALLGGSLPRMASGALALAQSGYSGGKSDFNSVIDAQKVLLELRLAQSEASLQRELALAELSILVVATVPPGATFNKAIP
ncbi:TolC family protein [Massilia sp. PAMC28688]|uniref:TolC family protein n=1 Tax=Massilia sp. PAMC28688 TaxID=2861283 RepID=UPI001C6334B2|nr:TolC family protein [Massilia sp. PAMC28688]QYF93076.1 TolC family protein [Massilia sp. PAMC28688]